MGDIFDEVDEILSADEPTQTLNESKTSKKQIETGPSASTSADKNFNEAELQDIMAEIENLEKEFEVDETKTNSNDSKIIPVVNHETVVKTNLQNEIDNELEISMNDKTETKIDIENENEIEIENEKVLPFEKNTEVKKEQNSKNNNNGKSSEISFEANGQMKLNLAFKVGDRGARLTIDPLIGMVVTMTGVELFFNEEEGLRVTTDSGVKFIIPLTSNAESGDKKKSA